MREQTASGRAVIMSYEEEEDRKIDTIEDGYEGCRGVCVGDVEDRVTRAADPSIWEEGGGEKRTSVWKY